MEIDVSKAITTVIAGEIIAKLTSEQREAVLAKALTDALNSYDLRNSVCLAVAKRAAAVAEELLESGKWDKRIRDAVLNGIAILEKQLPGAVATTIADALFGKEKDGYSGSCSKIRNMLDIPCKDTK